MPNLITSANETVSRIVSLIKGTPTITVISSPGAQTQRVAAGITIDQIQKDSRDMFKNYSMTLPTADPNQVIGTFASALFRTGKYVVQYSYANKYHSEEVLILHNGTDVLMTTYGQVFTDEILGDFSADIQFGGNVRLLTTPKYANTKIFVKGILVPNN